eukprot:1014311-Pyramimonas_sp.AAC.1
MVYTDGQTVRADEDTFEDIPLAEQHPYRHDEYPSSWISPKHPITQEEATGYMNVFTSIARDQWALYQRCPKGMHGATMSAVLGIFGER